MVKLPKGFVPVTNEAYYEIAWTLKRKLFQRARREGRGNLCRAVRIFRRLDLASGVRVEIATARDAKGASAGEFFTGKSELVVAERSTARAPSDIIGALGPALDNGAIRTTFAPLNYGSLVTEWLLAIADREFDAIVELGSGWGRNLFDLYCAGGPNKIPYYAAEFSESGRKITASFARLDRHAPIKPVFFDHRAPALPFLRKARRALIFSYHSIEQIAELPARYFDVLAAAAPQVVAVHFEPFGFQIGGDDPLTNEHRAFIREKKYNTNLLARLGEAEARGALSTRRLMANVFAPQPENPTSIAIWDNQTRRR